MREFKIICWSPWIDRFCFHRKCLSYFLRSYPLEARSIWLWVFMPLGAGGGLNLGSWSRTLPSREPPQWELWVSPHLLNGSQYQVHIKITGGKGREGCFFKTSVSSSPWKLKNCWEGARNITMIILWWEHFQGRDERHPSQKVCYLPAHLDGFCLGWLVASGLVPRDGEAALARPHTSLL